jgi:Flp pilus assembly protein TadG
MKRNNIATKADGLARGFARSTDGNVAMIFGFTLLILAACVGGAVDYGRWLNVNRHTQNAVDAAVIAAARVAQQTGDSALALATANEYYGQARSTFGVTDTVVFIQDTTRTNGWKVTGQGSVSTPFLSFIGITELPVKPKASASVALGGSGDSSLEISLMLDVTGSMCVDGSGPCTSDPKIAAVKKAASDLINTVVPDVQGASTSRVALVPFSGQIRVGADGTTEAAQLMKKLTNLDRYHSGYVTTGWACGENNNQWVKVWHPGSGSTWTSDGGAWGDGWWDYTCPVAVVESFSDFNWQVSPCVSARATKPGSNQWWMWYNDGTDGNYGTATDDAPGANTWLNGKGGGRLPLSPNSLDTPVDWGTGYSIPGVSRTGSRAYYGGNHNADGACWDGAWSNTSIPNTNIIMPLTADKQALKDRINSLAAFGTTAGPEATQWSWFMLSPNWSSIWPDASAPAPYSDTVAVTATGAAKVKKIAILMTDGVYNAYHGSLRSGATNAAELANYARKVCSNMKASGITIYTIGFGLNELPEADRNLATTMLKECSTDHQVADGSTVFNFYDANSTAALQSAYADIGQQLTKLRLTE